MMSILYNGYLRPICEGEIITDAFEFSLGKFAKYISNAW